MASFVLTDASVVINSVDLSDHVRSVTINASAEEVDDTNMGDTARVRLPGLLDWSIDIEMAQDFAASEVDATLWPLFSNKTTFTVVVKPTSAAVGATNPTYTGTGALFEYHPLDGAVGDLCTTPVTILSAGSALVRATS
jgi:hypothetical protein